MERQLSAWNSDASDCSDQELVARCKQLTEADCRLGAKLVVYIAEVDARGLYRRAYSSLFEFLAGELKMSDGQAALRMNAARLVQKYPVIVSMLASGAVHLSALRQISRLLTDENHVELLERVRGKSKREIEKLVAELAPKPDVPSQIRKLPQRAVGGNNKGMGGNNKGKAVAARAPLSVLVGQQLLAASESTSDTTIGASATSGPSLAAEGSSASSLEFVLEAPREKRGSCKPLSPESYEVKFTCDEKLQETLKKLQHLFRHRVPSGDIGVITRLAWENLLAQTMKKRFGVKTPSRKTTSTSLAKTEATTSERETKPKKNSRYIRVAIRRKIYTRDQGQCTFVSADGKRCGEPGLIQIHHDHAYSLGGEATVANLKLMCRTHNFPG